MRSRLDDVPVLKTLRTEVAAVHFNRLRLGVLRLGDPLRLELPRLRHLDLLVGRDIWICVDRMLYDLPVVAWTDFEEQGREALHEPVACTVRIFHAHADVVMPTIFSEADRVLRRRFAESRAGERRRR
jgi:hypothetical protein